MSTDLDPTIRERLAAELNGQPPTDAANTLEGRLAASEINLLDLIDGGIPDRAWLPASDRMLAVGARHHVAAPLKSGKSLAFLAHIADMAAAGAHVTILDRENGADEYARRLRDILADRPDDHRQAIADRLRYYAWPDLRLTDGAELAAALHGVDLVLFDSTRTFLSALSLGEDSSDDFAQFAAALIDPLFAANIATVQLDNSGHGDTKRARGSSSKGDLADVAYALKTTAPFDTGRRGKVRLERAAARYGDVAPAFTITLGGGHFGTFTPEAGEPDTPTFRPTILMERVSRALEDHPGLTKRAVRTTVKGNTTYTDAALELLIADGYVRAEVDGQAHHHHVVRAYRQNEDADRDPVTEPCSDRDLNTGEEDRDPVTPPIGARGTGHGSEDDTP